MIRTGDDEGVAADPSTGTSAIPVVLRRLMRTTSSMVEDTRAPEGRLVPLEYVYYQHFFTGRDCF